MLSCDNYNYLSHRSPGVNDDIDDPKDVEATLNIL